MTNKIRNFIYLDTDRLNSLYSQIFKGVASTIVESYFGEMFRSEESKNLIIGKTLAEKVSEVSTKTQNKILLDYMYNQLEEDIKDSMIDADNILQKSQLNDAFLIKIHGNIEIEDFSRLNEYFDKFNELGEAIAYSSITNSNNKSNSNIKEIAKKSGLSLDKRMLESMKLVFNFFNSNGYEIISKPIKNECNLIYRSIIDSKYLRITQDKIRLLYGAKPIMQWTIVGQVTYIPVEEDDIIINESSNEEVEIKPLGQNNVSKNMLDSLNAVEEVFLNIIRNKEDVRIAPIAIYIEN